MNFIFDFDGTICDSFEITIKILNEQLYKWKKSLIDIDRFRKNGIEEVIKDYKLNKLQILIYIFKGRRELAKHIDEMKTFTDANKVLKTISKSNKLGIVSSNSKKNIERFLKNNNLASYFDFIYSSPTLFEKFKKIESVMKKNVFKKNETVYIGDEVRDIKAAKKAGIKSVACSWGFADRKLLQKNNPDFLINEMKELISVEKQIQH